MRKKTQSLLIMLSVLAFLVINPARAQQYMRINQSDGSVLEIAIADIQKLTFDLTTAIEQHPEVAKQLLKLKVYPNPSREKVVLDYSLQHEGIVTIEIFNLNGLLLEKITQGFQQPGDHHHLLSTKHLSSGTYLCRIQQNNQFVTEKIVVKH